MVEAKMDDMWHAYEQLATTNFIIRYKPESMAALNELADEQL